MPFFSKSNKLPLNFENLVNYNLQDVTLSSSNTLRFQNQNYPTFQNLKKKKLTKKYHHHQIKHSVISNSKLSHISYISFKIPYQEKNNHNEAYLYIINDEQNHNLKG